jgi:hypothetical protein
MLAPGEGSLVGDAPMFVSADIGGPVAMVGMFVLPRACPG